MKLTHSDVYAWSGDTLAALREALRTLDFIEILPAILSERYEPGARHSIAVLGDRALPEFETGQLGISVRGKESYYLPVSHCVEKQLALEHAQRVYCIAPCVRLLMAGEEATGRHLCTFFQAEIEWRTEHTADVYRTIELLLSRFVDVLLPRLADSGRLDEATHARVAALARTPYERMTFDEARKHVSGIGGAANPHATGDLTHAEENALSETVDGPLWLTDYPVGVRDSLYRNNGDGTFATYDLILPGGYGEVATGGLRPDSAEDILRQAASLSTSAHPLYAEWKARTRLQTGGIGFGVERLIRYCAGAGSVTELTAAHDQGPNARIGR